MKLPALILVVVMAFVSGCMSNVPMDVTQSKRASAIPAGYTVPVRPGLKMATLEDSLAMAGSTFNVHSGKIFRQVFVGGDEARANVEIISSHITQAGSDYMILATTVTVTYTATALLKFDGKTQTITAIGTAHTKWDVTDAAKEAIERAVVDLARQSAALIESR